MGLYSEKKALWNKELQKKLKNLQELLPVYDLCNNLAKEWVKEAARDYDISLIEYNKDMQVNLHFGPNDNLKRDAVLLVEKFEETLKPLGFSLRESRELTPTFRIAKGQWWITLYFNLSGSKCRAVEKETGEYTRPVPITETEYICED